MGVGRDGRTGRHPSSRSGFAGTGLLGLWAGNTRPGPVRVRCPSRRPRGEGARLSSFSCASYVLLHLYRGAQAAYGLAHAQCILRAQSRLFSSALWSTCAPKSYLSSGRKFSIYLPMYKIRATFTGCQFQTRFHSE